MDASHDLHVLDLSSPSTAWLERLLGFKNLKEALTNTEGPPIFARVASLDELREGLALSPNCPLSLITSPRTQLPAFLKSLEAIPLSSEPGEWRKDFECLEASSTDAALIVYLQNPQLLDGSTLPPELLARLLEDLSVLKKKWTRVVIVSDETLGGFAWDLADDPAQMARMPAASVADWELHVAYRPEFLLGPDQETPDILLWSAPKSRATWKSRTPKIASPVAWKLLQRDLNQGIEIVRFRHLAMRNLKTLGTALGPLTRAGKIQIDHWPLSGFWITLKLPDRGDEDPQLLTKRLEKQGIKLYPRPLRPGEIVFSYVLDNAKLRQGLERLVAALEVL